MTEQSHVVDRYLRLNKLPHIWCAGCGNGIVMNSIILAVDKLGLDQNQVVIAAGIGCSSRANGYMDFCGVHTNHGRALAYATGIKMANPRLKVIVVTGDGDCTSIGGNHFIHACRRNIDISVVVFNNSNYGMTGGQYSPTTPQDARTKTSPYGNIEPEFDVCELAKASGATYVARSTTYQANHLTKCIMQAIDHRGLAVVDAICDCPTLFGRLNKRGGPVEMMKAMQARTVNLAQAAKLQPEELADKIVIGEFVNRKDRPEYSDRYRQLIAKAGGGEING